jgi:hypothetical protein
VTWFANLLVLIGLVLAGSKNRFAFVFTAVGEVIWCGCGLWKGMYDLATICAVFAVIAVVNFFRWNREGGPEKTAVCIDSGGYVDLEPGRRYRLKADAAAGLDGLVRVYDDSGDDYLYPKRLFRLEES